MTETLADASYSRISGVFMMSRDHPLLTPGSQKWVTKNLWQVSDSSCTRAVKENLVWGMESASFRCCYTVNILQGLWRKGGRGGRHEYSTIRTEHWSVSKWKMMETWNDYVKEFQRHMRFISVRQRSRKCPILKVLIKRSSIDQFLQCLIH